MRTIKVQGSGHVSAKPDIAVLSFGIEHKAKGYQESVEGLNSRVADLRSSLVACGLDRHDLKTDDFRISIDSQYKDGQRIQLGFRASHDLRIELPADMELLNRVLHTIASGRNEAGISLSFSVKDQAALHKRVLENAVTVAGENAATLAQAAGVRLGELVRIDYGWTEVRFESRDYAVDCACEAATGPDIEPEDIRARDSVTLEYAIV